MLPHSHNCEGSSYSGSNSSRHRGSVHKLIDTFLVIAMDNSLFFFLHNGSISFADNLHIMRDAGTVVVVVLAEGQILNN